MGTVVRFPSAKAAFSRQKKKRLDKQREILNGIYAQSYDKWAVLLAHHWPHYLPRWPTTSA